MSDDRPGGSVGADWLAEVEVAMAVSLGAQQARSVIERTAAHVPAGYDELSWPSSAAIDLPIIDRLAAQSVVDGRPAVETAVTHFIEAAADEWRFRVYRAGDAVPLAELLPLLDHLGLRAIDERSFRFQMPAATVWLHDVGVQVPAGCELHAEVQRAFIAEFLDIIEVDGLNRLVLRAGLDVRQVEVLRGYTRYMRQIGAPASQMAIEGTLVRYSGVARLLVDLFTIRLDPTIVDRSAEESIRRSMTAALDAVPGLDDDRTLRTMLALIDATVRTNAFRPGPNNGHREVLALKLDSSKVPDLPLPRPQFEIWVCSPRVEGVHLRNGRIARGGIRWSDRREDFRTEVLGLVKAQIVKNAVIVPTGAKGGFVAKRTMSSPEATRAEGLECYRLFIAGLLDLTDNVLPGDVVEHPPHTVCRDAHDPYLVVAADKGTASFSDAANAIAAEYEFWLGDAFASGGSAGYDHKEMAITARGAWESVRRHAASLGLDVDRDHITTVGIGDMSGDVFGNGLLRSSSVRLVAAFDHRHIFIDPDPDPDSSYVERRRLFGLSRSSWADYDSSLLSPGGGVYERTLKTIDIGAQAAARLGVDRTTFTPNELIAAILRAPVDLLWNGGIGTYVKAAAETHADVGDRSNDAVRVDASELRCRMVGEGGNLGFTQRARVEYALSGGLINTDAIDNSAGVDCSDHEVNIKILLGPEVRSGALSVDDRDRLLREMTDAVAELVLDDNRAQTLALAIARRQALPMVNVHSRYLSTLESEGWLNRSLEHLPTDRQIAERQTAGVGLTTPEFAVLLAYTKTSVIAELEASDLPDDPFLRPELVRYFPAPLRERFPEQIQRHRLRREIVATQVGNQLVNLSGISFLHRVAEETGVADVDTTRAWLAARDVLGLVDLWERVTQLSGRLPVETQLDLFLELRSMAERSTLWLLRHRRLPLDIQAAVDTYRDGMAALVALEGAVRGPLREVTSQLEAARVGAGVPPDLARVSVQWPLLHTCFDIIDLSTTSGTALAEVATIYWHVFDALDLTWLWQAIGALPRSTRWQTQARSALRDDLVGALADLAADVLSAGGVGAWQSANERLVARAIAMFTELRRVDAHDLTTLSVAVRQLRMLALLT